MCGAYQRGRGGQGRQAPRALIDPLFLTRPTCRRPANLSASKFNDIRKVPPVPMPPCSGFGFCLALNRRQWRCLCISLVICTEHTLIPTPPEPLKFPMCAVVLNTKGLCGRAKTPTRKGRCRRRRRSCTNGRRSCTNGRRSCTNGWCTCAGLVEHVLQTSPIRLRP